jgi:hypothetical protein
MTVNFPRHGGRGATVNLGTKNFAFWVLFDNFLFDAFYDKKH